MSITSSIIYALIGYHDKPLCAYSEYKGTFQKVCQNFLHNIEENSSGGYKIDDYFIFYINENGISYVIMTDVTYSRITATACLESIQREFKETYKDKDFEVMGSFSLDPEFKPKLKMKYEYFNENKEVINESTRKLRDEIFRMKDEILNASDSLNLRGDKLQNVNDKADNLQKTSYNYRKGATRVRKSESNKKTWIIIGTVGSILVIGYFLSVIVCGSFTFQCSK